MRFHIFRIPGRYRIYRIMILVLQNFNYLSILYIFFFFCGYKELVPQSSV